MAKEITTDAREGVDQMVAAEGARRATDDAHKAMRAIIAELAPAGRRTVNVEKLLAALAQEYTTAMIANGELAGEVAQRFAALRQGA